ncbi:MAG TPA: cytochrome c [Methylophilus sp.]|nr:cytochrome c [Methylophilus sp.]
MKMTSGLIKIGFTIVTSFYALHVLAVSPADIKRGEYLARVGDCVSCHTAPHGKDFAGGLPMLTPVGAVYTTNITPDPDTGIGKYTESEFAKALRRGVAKDGHHLYPAMPYPSYAKVSDEDIHYLYVYFKHGVKPVRQANKASDIPWPLNYRFPLAVWNALFLDKDVYKPDSTKDANWNRGAYLVQGLGHCGACHTPRGLAFQEKALTEKSDHFLSGETLEGWSATNLRGDHNTGLGRWSEGDILVYLKTGANQHSSAFGTMTPVINNSTEGMSIQDLAGISKYLKTLKGTDDKGQKPYQYDTSTTLAQFKEPTKHTGARLYQQYCAACHGQNGKGVAPYLSPLAGNPAVMDPDPSALINVILNGSPQLKPQGISAPFNMPKFRHTLNDHEVAELVSFMQKAWNHNLDATNAKKVTKIRALPPTAH